MPLEREILISGTYALGPATVLSSMLLSIASNAVWSRNLGETSCRWRRPYSPDGRAFIIWSFIYFTTLISCICQLTGQTPVLGWYTNMSWGVSWTLCALWPPYFDGETPEALRAAASILLAAAAWATLAVSEEVAWSNNNEKTACILLTVPLSAFVGWLWVASVLGWGIANAASGADSDAEACYVPPRRADETAYEYRYRRRVLYRQAQARMPTVVSIVPLLVAFAIAILSALIPDPLIVVPVAWAVVNLKAFPSNVYLLALVVLGIGATVAGIRAELG